MKTQRRLGMELFSRRFEQIEASIAGTAVQYRLGPEERQELYSLTMLKIVEDDFAVLRNFQGKCRWQTYLAVVARRVLLDFRTREWGRWRPCALARRLGATAVRLDRLINRDGLEPAEAVRDLLARVEETEPQLEALAERIPRRARRRVLNDEQRLARVPGLDAADRRVEAAEGADAAARVVEALASSLRALPPQERHLLDLRFCRGWTVKRIADSRKAEPRSLYRRFHRLLRRLRRSLEGLGLTWEDVAWALDVSESEVQPGLLESEDGLAMAPRV